VKRQLYLKVLLIGLTSLVLLAVAAIVVGPGSWLGNLVPRLMLLVVIGQVGALIQIAVAPKTPSVKTNISDTAHQKKQWILVVVWMAFLIILGIFSVVAAKIFAAPPRSNFVAFVITVSLAFFAGMTILWGVSAKLGLLRFRPAAWLRWLFKIPDDYQPRP
jgi:hypothetical protein